MSRITSSGALPRQTLAPGFHLLLGALAALVLLLSGAGEVEAQQSGEFRVSNYGSGTITNNFVWRGYYFEVERETTLTHLIGGGGATPSGQTADGNWTADAPFWVGLYAATRSGETITLDQLLTADGLKWNGVGPDQQLPVGAIVLQPGQGYFIGQGRSGSAGHHWAMDNSSGDGLQVDDLLQNPIISDWAPNPGPGNPARAYVPGGSGATNAPEVKVGQSFATDTPVLPRVGFRFETDHVQAELPQVEPTTSVLASERAIHLSALLTDAGVPDGGEATLFFQFAENTADLDNAGTTRAATPGTGGDGTEFSLQIAVNPGSTYHFRAMAINEAGVTHGPQGSITVPSLQELGLMTIRDFAGDPDRPAPTVQDYTDAGVTGVSQDNLDQLNGVVAGTDPEELETAQDVQAIVNDLPMITIRAYADDQTGLTPTLATYTDAGVTGVTSDNLENLNRVIAGMSSEDLAHLESVQAIVDDLPMIIIRQHADDPELGDLTVEDYANAGITGVDADNLNDMNEILQEMGADVLSGPEVIQGIVNDLPMIIIRRHLEDTTRRAPTPDDYADAGVNRVTSDNVDLLTTHLHSTGLPESAGPAELQEILDLLLVIDGSSVDAPESARTGEVAQVVITMLDEMDGNPIEGLRYPELAVQVSGANPQILTVRALGEGRYEATYPLRQAGSDRIQVSYRGSPLRGSPFELAVTEHIVAPGAPEMLGGQAGNGSVSLEWAPPASDGGTPVTHYRVQVFHAGGRIWLDAPGGYPIEPRTTIHGLENHRSYLFRVAATTDFGNGAFSEPTGALVPSGPVEIPELNPGETHGSRGGVAGMWTVEALDGGTTHYRMDDQELRLRSRDAGGVFRPLAGSDDAPILELVPGGSIQAGGGHFAAGTGVTLWLAPGDRRLGTVHVAEDGTLVGIVVVPHDLAQGPMTLQVTGLDEDGELVVLNLGVQVAGVSPDLEIRMEASDTAPAPGDEITVTITITNLKSATASATAIDTGLDHSRLEILHADPSQGTFDIAEDRWTPGEVAPGATATLTVRAVIRTPTATETDHLR